MHNFIWSVTHLNIFSKNIAYCIPCWAIDMCVFFSFERWNAKVHMQLKWCTLNLLPKILDVRSHRQEQLFYSDLSRISSEAQRQPLRTAPTNLPFVGLKHHHFLNGTVRISTKIFCLMYIFISKCWESELWTACKR